MKLKKTTGLIATSISIVFLIEYLNERKKKTPIWKYEARPPRRLNWDKWVRVITNPLMKLVAGGIVSHFWDWRRIPDKNYKGQLVKLNQDSWYSRFKGKEIKVWHHAMAHSRWGMQKVYILGLDQKYLVKKGQKVDGYHYGLQVKGMENISVSRIYIPADEKVKVLISSGPIKVLALDSKYNELPVVLEGPFDRKDKSHKHLRQF